MGKECGYDPQTGTYLGKLAEAQPRMSSATMQDWIDFPDALREYQAGLVVSPYVVKVDRSAKAAYPDWVKEVLHPELESTGSAEFNLKTLELWFHPNQQNGGVITGNPIYEHLRDNGMLPTCLNLQDGLAIQKKGIAVFRKFFEGKAVFLWKSAVQSRNGNLFVPYLCEGGARVVVSWDRLDFDFHDDDPAARFGK